MSTRREVELAREEILRILNILQNIVALKVEPFSVNVASLLERLRRVIEENRDLETIALDAETIYQISIVLGMQQKWIRERAASLFIDSQVIYSRIIASDQRSLVEALLRAWRPLVRIEQVSIPLLLRGYEHFLSLPSRGVAREEPVYGSLPGGVAGYEVEEREKLMDKVNELWQELLSRGEEWIDYWEIVGSGDLQARYERAYLLSFLISSGLVDVSINTLTDEIKIRARREKDKEERRTSLVISIGE